MGTSLEPANEAARAEAAGRERPGLRVGSLFRSRTSDAVAKTLVCFAVLHQILLVIYAVRHGDIGVFNVFTMLEAQRLVPRLGTGTLVQLASGLFALGVYAGVRAFLTRRDRAGAAEGSGEARMRSRPGGRGAAPRMVLASARASAREWPAAIATRAHAAAKVLGVFRPSMASGLLLFAGGLLVHMTCLSAIERFTTSYPSVHDEFMARLPYVDFGWPGELYFFAFVAAVTLVHVRTQRSTVAGVFAKLGLFYAVRGVFLFLLPIGSPADAPPIASRFVLYPFPNHAYFPGGHVGLMTILSLSVRDTRWRRGFLVATALFALGTILARTHYTADAFGGWLLGYAVTSWGRRHIAPRA
jgi:hypothetical protein